MIWLCFQFGHPLFLSPVLPLWKRLSTSCWVSIEKVDILVSFLILEEKFAFSVMLSVALCILYVLRYVPSIICWQFLSCRDVEFYPRPFLLLLRLLCGFCPSFCWYGVFYFILCIWVGVLPVMCMHSIYRRCPRQPEKDTRCPGTGLQIAVSCHMGTHKQAQVLCKSDQCF